MIRVKAFSLKAFRGYPFHQSFDLHDGQSLLLFGRNGHGKSSISDAFEFLVNEHGTLERLGLRKGPTTSGRSPMRNVQATGGVASIVTLDYSVGKTDVSAIREVSETRTKVPDALGPFVDAAVVPFVVRGPELRKFVYETPQSRYEELAAYLNASRLTALQKDIRELQKQLGKDQRVDEQQRKALCSRLASATNSAVRDWKTDSVVAWLNGMLAEVGLDYVTQTNFDDPALADLKIREANERSTTAIESAKGILSELLRRESGAPAVLTWKTDVRAAESNLNRAAEAASEAPIAELVDAAQRYLAVPEHNPKTCPLCETPFVDSPLKSRAGVVSKIDLIRERLADLSAAKTELAHARVAMNERVEQWLTRAATALDACGVSAERREPLERALRSVLQDDEEVRKLRDAAGDILHLLEAALDEKSKGAQGKYVALYERVDAALEIGERIIEIDARMNKRSTLADEISKARAYIDAEVHGFFTSTVREISDRTVAFYRSVQRNSPVPVAISVSMVAEDNGENRGIELLIDFGGVTGQKPQAYLSDSQQNTLALGLRLAIIRHFNCDLPFVILDDVVTSFDAEMRKTTAQTLITQLSDLQMIVLTHDDVFWRALRDHAAPKQANWKIRRIARYDRESGPMFVDAKPDPELVREAISSGEAVGARIRGFWDSWLRGFARQVGARPLMPSPNDPHNYPASDLFESVVRATSRYGLKQRTNADPAVAGIISTLQANALLNSATHQAEPIDGVPSDGDLEAVFNDIETFIALFQCECAERRFSYNVAQDVVRCRKCGGRLFVDAKKSDMEHKEREDN